MKTIMYSLYDRAVMVYGRPVFAPAWGALARDLEEVLIDPNSMIAKHPADFDIYELGSFEDSSGDFQMYPRPLLVCNVGAMVNRPLPDIRSEPDASGASAKPV